MKRAFSPTLIEPSPQYTTGTEESWHCRRAFLKLILNEDKRLLKQSYLYDYRTLPCKENLLYLPTLFFTLPLCLMYGSQIVC